MEKQPIIEIFMLILSILAMLFFFATARAATPGYVTTLQPFGGFNFLNLLRNFLAF
jgi:hypothetical protein